MQKNEKPPVPVRILWMDAFEGPQGWMYLSEYEPKEVTPITLGWIFQDGPKLEGYTTVYSTHFTDDEGATVVADPNHIPDKMIIHIDYLDL